MKKLLSIALALVFLFNSAQITYATTYENTNPSNQNAVLSIADPETGEVWEWEIEIESSTASSNSAPRQMPSSDLRYSEVNIDISEYLNQTFDYMDRVYNTKDDDITLEIGLYYYYNPIDNTIRLYNVYGSTSRSDLYYAENRLVYCTNQFANVRQYFYPSSDEWSYATDSSVGNYRSDIPPFARLNCEVHVTGMAAYREVWVDCSVDV